MKPAQGVNASYRMFLKAILAFTILTPSVGYTENPKPDVDAPATVAPPSPALDSKAQKAAPTAFAAAEPKPVLRWGVGDGKSYWIPAAEVFSFDFLLNQINRHFVDSVAYGSDLSSIRDNLHSKWVVDTDPFAVNQFMHPYQGSMYQGFARSAGVGFWGALGYTTAGSLLWEIAGERTTPSINDQVSSGISGSFLGEPLFRIASLLLESGGGRPGVWRELGAAAISPATGFNRVAFGKRFDGVFRSHDPAVYTRIEVGASINSNIHSNVNLGTDVNGEPILQSIKQHEANIDFTMGYGLPGKPGYTYTRPFDYFHFQFRASTASIFEHIMSRGLLYGEEYAVGQNYRGIWGVYGSYDYIAPQVFRISTTAASVGTTGQLWVSRAVAVQGTVLGGLGYGAAGTIRASGIGGAAANGSGDRDYHYGLTPQGLAALRVIFGDRASVDMTAREYYVSRVAATESTGQENIIRADISFTVRVYRLHGITLRYVESYRDSQYGGQSPTHQSIGTVSIVYSFIGQTRFGAVDWRSAAAGGP